MNFRKVAIMGLGAVGSYFYLGLSERKDTELMVIAKDSRKKRLETEGIEINGNRYYPRVCSPDEAEDIDLIIVSLKFNALQPALTDIKKCISDKTVVLCPMNGVESEDIIGSAVGEDKLVYSVIKIASERIGGSVKFDVASTIGVIYGEMDANRKKDRIEALNALFEGTIIRYRASDVILSEIWSKFLLNIGSNLPQAIVGCGMGGYADSEHMAFLAAKLREEVLALAKAKGIDPDKADLSAGVASKARKGAMYSTLQDITEGRETEIEAFSGAVIKMGKELGIPTPYNEFTYHVIKALEEKNAGLFNYDS